MKSSVKITYLLLLVAVFGFIAVNEWARYEGKIVFSFPGFNYSIYLFITINGIILGNTSMESKKFMRSAIATTKRLGAMSAMNARNSKPLNHLDATDQPQNSSSRIPHDRTQEIRVVEATKEKLEQENAKARMKIAFAITITRDGSVIDGSCVLAYSIIKAHMKSNIDISFVAFVHPTATNSVEPLKRLGYQ